MKPGEFDDLVRQKFDQNDFEYNPRNWEKLTDELDGEKKRRGLLFWWMPLMGVAATVAMAFGVSTVLRHEGGADRPAQYAQVEKHTTAPAQAVYPAARIADVIPAQDASAEETIVNENTLPIAARQEEKADEIAINKDNTPATNGTKAVVLSAPVNIAGTFAIDQNAELLKKKKKVVAAAQGYYTFKEDEVKKKDPKVAIILSGGVSYSNQSNGYTVGATARRMISDKVYVESDIAFTGTNNTRTVSYMDNSGTTSSSGSAGNASGAVFGAKAAVTAGKNTDEALKATTNGGPQGVLKTQDQAYNLYYAQVTPSIGYKVMRRLSIGVGPDFQQMLVDNRPEASANDRGNIKVAPMFDIGFMGKTEFAVTKNMKAAVYYREGINNVITPTNKYIDRNYLQFQIKCTILNR